MRSSILRVPLQTGAGALQSILLSLMMMPFLAVGVAALLGVSASRTPRELGVFGLVVTAIGGLVTLAFVLQAHRRCASDLVLTEEGFHVWRGPHDGFSCTWAEVRSMGVDVLRNERESVTVGGEKTYRHDFVVGGIVLASTTSSEEIESLRSLRDALRAASRATSSQRTTVRATRTTVVVCARCGAPLAPVDAPVAPCAYCGAQTAMPLEVRDRVRKTLAIGAARAHADALVARLVQQPGPKRTNGALVLGAASLYVGLPAALSLFVGGRRELAGVCAAAVLLAFTLARSFIASRRALRAIALGFVATKPDRVGAPPRCRRCAAPLHVPSESASVVRCAYCAAANVTTIAVARDEGEATASEDELELALAHRKRARVSLGTMVAAALAIAVLGFVPSRWSPRASGGAPARPAPPSASAPAAASTAWAEWGRGNDDPIFTSGEAEVDSEGVAVHAYAGDHGVRFTIPVGDDGALFPGRPVAALIDATGCRAYAADAKIVYEPFTLEAGQRVRGRFVANAADCKHAGRFDVPLQIPNPKALQLLTSARARTGPVAGTAGGRPVGTRHVFARMRAKTEPTGIASIVLSDSTDCATYRFHQDTYVVVSYFGGASAAEPFLGTPQPAQVDVTTRGASGASTLRAWVIFDEVAFEPGAKIKGRLYAHHDDTDVAERIDLGGAFVATVCP